MCPRYEGKPTRRVPRPGGHRGPGTGRDPRRPRSPTLTWPAGPASCVPVPPGRQIQTPVWSRTGLRHPPGSDLASPDTGPGDRCAGSGTEVRRCRSSGQVQAGRMRFSRRVNAIDLNEARIPADLAGRRDRYLVAAQVQIWLTCVPGRPPVQPDPPTTALSPRSAPGLTTWPTPTPSAAICPARCTGRSSSPGMDLDRGRRRTRVTRGGLRERVRSGRP